MFPGDRGRAQYQSFPLYDEVIPARDGCQELKTSQVADLFAPQQALTHTPQMNWLTKPELLNSLSLA